MRRGIGILRPTTIEALICGQGLKLSRAAVGRLQLAIECDEQMMIFSTGWQIILNWRVCKWQLQTLMSATFVGFDSAWTDTAGRLGMLAQREQRRRKATGSLPGYETG
jgi:hypothetical protein